MSTLKPSVSASSFSIGLRFYYWQFYKHIDQLPHKDNRPGRITDHSGYKVRDLYVKKKYNSFGEEIKNYRYIDIKQYNDIIMIKAQQYITTEMAKSIKSQNPENRLFPKHYEIARDTALGINNLISIILYTDFTGLCSDFSSTFRKIYPYETLSSIKRRNSKYWWLSKILRETVELFADRKISRFKQTYYTGISFAMSIPSFSIRLCSPTSTSVHLEVACKFSGEQGLILQLNVGRMMGHGSGTTCFDCSWISRYNEEDERYHYVCYLCF